MRSIVLMIALCLVALPLSFAQTVPQGTNTSLGDNTSILVNESQVGPIPGDLMYGFKRFFENVDTFLTFDKADLAQKEAHYANMRAVEAHILSDDAKKQEAEGKFADENVTLQELNSLLADNANDTLKAEGDLESAVSDGSANQTVVDAVHNNTRNSILLLQNIFARAPEPARDSILRALNNSINNEQQHYERLYRIEGRIGNFSIDLNQTWPQGNGSWQRNGNGFNGSGISQWNGSNGNPHWNVTVGNHSPGHAGHHGGMPPPGQ